MLRSLEIQNYRNLRHLTIEKLGRVNLLVGKNNTGKTSVLEAVSILIHRASTRWISQLLDDRGEHISRATYQDPDQLSSSNAERLSNLFYGREQHINVSYSIAINEVGEIPSFDPIKIRLVKYVLINREDEMGNVIQSKIISDSSNDQAELGLEITASDYYSIISLNRRFGSSVLHTSVKENCQFVKTNNITRETNGQLWDKVTLTEKQKYVEDALRIVEGDIQQLAFVNSEIPISNSRLGVKIDQRIAVAKMNNFPKPISVRSMGDGINRILTIILAMVNCENGYLLIDEFENGLHYSVQEKLWEIVFYLAERLNIQVFATTHSLDCVEAFSAVLNNGKQDKESGMMIRLENYKGSIEATVYDADEIQSTTRVHVDPR